MIYGKIALCHTSYTLGGARVFLSLWALQKLYSLAVAGLIWLLHYPLMPVRVKAETVKRKIMKKHMERQYSLERSFVPPQAQDVALALVSGV
jgi:hypothetical protein